MPGHHWSGIVAFRLQAGQVRAPPCCDPQPDDPRSAEATRVGTVPHGLTPHTRLEPAGTNTSASFTNAQRAESAKIPGPVRRALAGSLALVLIVVMFINGLTFGNEDWVGSAATIIGAGALMLSAYKNWRVLWNRLGLFFRTSLGEKTARNALGVIGAAFALGGLFGTIAR